MDPQGRPGRARPAESPYQKDLLFSQASSSAYTAPPRASAGSVPPSVSEESAIAGHAREQDRVTTYTDRTPQGRPDAGMYEEKMDLLHGVAQTDFDGFPEGQGKRPRHGPFSGRRSRADCRYRVCTQKGRRASAGRRRVSLSTTRLFSFGVLLFLLSFYTRKCLDERLSEIPSLLTSFHHNRKKREEKLSYFDGREPFRRLAEREAPGLSRAQQRRNIDAAEHALCSAIGDSAWLRRAAALQPFGEERDGQMHSLPSTEPTGMGRAGQSGERARSILAGAVRVVFVFA